MFRSMCADTLQMEWQTGNHPTRLPVHHERQAASGPAQQIGRTLYLPPRGGSLEGHSGPLHRRVRGTLQHSAEGQATAAGPAAGVEGDLWLRALTRAEAIYFHEPSAHLNCGHAVLYGHALPDKHSSGGPPPARVHLRIRELEVRSTCCGLVLVTCSLPLADTRFCLCCAHDVCYTVCSVSLDSVFCIGCLIPDINSTEQASVV